jgi:hypothetical protein
MNYTLIAYTEDSSYHNRCGDYIHQPGSFETFFTRDKTELIEKWANWSFSGNFESLDLLLNGIPDNQFSEEEDQIWNELDVARSNRYQELKQEKIQQDKKLAEEKVAKDLLDKARREQLQRLQDLDTLAALKKKLGVS